MYCQELRADIRTDKSVRQDGLPSAQKSSIFVQNSRYIKKGAAYVGNIFGDVKFRQKKGA